jgi:hypothetical protein
MSTVETIMQEEAAETVKQIAELKSNSARMFPVVWGHRALVEETLMYTAKDVIGCLIEAEMDLHEAVESLCLQDGVEPWEMDEAAQQAFEYYAHNFTQGCLEWLINHIDMENVVEDERLPRGVVVTTGDGKGNMERRVGTGPPDEEAEEDEEDYDEEAENQRGLRSQMERKKPCRGCWSHYREDESGHIVCDCTE